MIDLRDTPDYDIRQLDIGDQFIDCDGTTCTVINREVGDSGGVIRFGWTTG